MPKRRSLWPFTWLPSPSTQRPPEFACRSHAWLARTVGLRGNAIATDGVNSIRRVASAAKASGAYQSCPTSTVIAASKPASSASCAAWLTSAQCRCGKIVKIRMRSAARQTTLHEFQPILTPEDLVTDHVAWRAEYAAIQRRLRVGLAHRVPFRFGTVLHNRVGVEA